ncbi:respiratory nitrate reductase subunit gamma [Desulfallas thermosapovorans]|uniref:Nitrate reductase gamma subunit n=1 Tax=Desulfallas thermosapovorans DSM 6562 TaxID=1121431 RepID=A0A5S4ZUP3_9FIRM|nr:respiratory nitrate reductase subunit gamma [Desulfallas thermosapovorans]TYO96514.1 nitrate reductase gamma subunit [Desulfallas thermosapovorans DSM 6562]
MKLLIGQILPYITVTLFTLGILYRLGRWAGARIVHNITLSPWLQTNGQVAVRIGSEAFLFRNLFRFDKALWAGALLMHFALLNVLGGHIVGFGFLGEQFALIPGLGITPELSRELSDLLGSIMGIALFVGLLYLLIRRFTLEKVKLVTKPSDNLWLIYLLVLVGIGNIMRFIPAFHIEYEMVFDYIAALIMFQPVVHMEILNSGFFLAHYLLVQVLLIVFPFSKLMHLFGMFAERYIVNRVYHDPAPGLPNVDVAAARKAGLGVPAGDAAEEGV